MPSCVAPEDSGWTFCPSSEAAILFTVLYGLFFFIHIYLAAKSKKPFCWVIIMGCAWLTIGFSLRAKAAYKINGLGDFIPQSIIIFLAPLWLNGFVYMVLGRMAYMLLRRGRIYGIRARHLTLIFVILDIVAFFVQSSSSGLLSDSNPNTAQIGVYIMMAGVGVQQAFITIFVVLLARFHYVLHTGTGGGRQGDIRMDEGSTDTTPSSDVRPAAYTVPWRRLLYALYGSLGLITVRNIFRFIEFSDGVHGFVATHEAFFYALDALPVLLVLVVLAVVHPSCVLTGPDSEFPSRKARRKRRRDRSRTKRQREDGDESTFLSE